MTYVTCLNADALATKTSISGKHVRALPTRIRFIEGAVIIGERGFGMAGHSSEPCDSWSGCAASKSLDKSLLIMKRTPTAAAIGNHEQRHSNERMHSHQVI